MLDRSVRHNFKLIGLGGVALCGLGLAANIGLANDQPVVLAQYQELVINEPLAGETVEDDTPSIEEIDLNEVEPDSLEADDPEQVVEQSGEGAELSDTLEATADESIPVDPDYRMSVTLDLSGNLAFRGMVPDGSSRNLLSYLVDSSEELNGVSVSEGAPDGFMQTLFAGISALRELDSGQVAFANGNWLLTGYAAIDTKKNAAEATLARLSDDGIWRIMITAPDALEVCRTAINEFMSENTLLFGSGSAQLTDNSRELLPELAERLNICPDQPVYVEGHTDSDGGDALNLRLSIARAETVVDELIDLGVAVTRLYAVGYGASLPIASNATVEGKRQNRRIVFNFEDIAAQ